MDPSDFVELVVFQNSGEALEVLSSGDTSPEFMLVKVA
jgi:hypothetical protein